jgi:hypothetical protein
MPKPEEPLDAYRRVRKPVPPPGRAIPDRRRKAEKERARREMDDERDHSRREDDPER